MRVLTKKMVTDMLAWWLMEYKRTHPGDFASPLKRDRDRATECEWAKGLVMELIDRINGSIADPVVMIEDYYYRINRILAESPEENYVAHRFAGFMAAQTYEILRYLKANDAIVFAIPD